MVVEMEIVSERGIAFFFSELFVVSCMIGFLLRAENTASLFLIHPLTKPCFVLYVGEWEEEIRLLIDRNDTTRAYVLLF